MTEAKKSTKNDMQPCSDQLAGFLNDWVTGVSGIGSGVEAAASRTLIEACILLDSRDDFDRMNAVVQVVIANRLNRVQMNTYVPKDSKVTSLFTPTSEEKQGDRNDANVQNDDARRTG